METIAISKFKAKCLGILEEIHKQKKRVIITKRGVPIAEIRAIEPSEKKGVPKSKCKAVPPLTVL